MSYSVGIDLGTTNSVLCVWKKGRVETIPVDGSPLVPSAVSLRPDGALLVGRTARNRARVYPVESVTSAKRRMGDGTTRWEIHGKSYTPVDVSALVLGYLREAAEGHLGQAVTDAVITVPAYFDNRQKSDTRLAGERAGFRVLQLLPEPTAAAISYGLDRGKDQTILVYDLGGGTFDVSLLRVERNKFHVIGVGGDSRLGGDDFDRILAEHLSNLLHGRARADLAPVRAALRGELPETDPALTPELRKGIQQLLEAAERAKCELSISDLAQITLPEILGTTLETEISLPTYNLLISPLVDHTIEKMRAVLREARLTEDEVDRIILVGGSTRNRLVRKRLTAALKEPWASDRVDESVAMGAAVVAAYLQSPAELPVPVEIRNVTPFPLGLRATRDGDEDFFRVLIPKNTPLPHTAQHEFTTLRDNQRSVRVAVFQGESAHCAENIHVGGFLLEGIPPAPAGVPEILVRFQMDLSDLLTVTATSHQQQTTQTLDVNLVSEDVEARAPSTDIIFLIDTSGSMSRELDGVKHSCLAFAAEVEDAGIECRLGLVDFAMPGGSYRWEVFPPVDASDLAPAIQKLAIGRLGYGGCYVGEPSCLEVIRAFADAFPTRDRSRIGILISDEAGNDVHATNETITILKEAGITLFVLGVPSSCHERIAAETGGYFWNINETRGKVDFAQVLGRVAAEITNLALR